RRVNTRRDIARLRSSWLLMLSYNKLPADQAVVSSEGRTRDAGRSDPSIVALFPRAQERRQDQAQQQASPGYAAAVDHIAHQHLLLFRAQLCLGLAQLRM